MRLAKLIAATFLALVSCGCGKTDLPVDVNGRRPFDERETDMRKAGTELHRVLLEGLDPKVDLADLLCNLDETPVKTKAEARAICQVLRTIPSDNTTRRFTSRLHAVTALFRDVETRQVGQALRA